MSRYLITFEAPDQDAAALEDATAHLDDRVVGIVRGDVDGVPVAARVLIEVEAPTSRLVMANGIISSFRPMRSLT